MDHGIAPFDSGPGGLGPRGCRFFPRFGFGHHHLHHHLHPHHFPHGPHHGAPFFDTPGLEETEDSMAENTEEISGEESLPGHCNKVNHSKKNKCKHFKTNMIKDRHFVKCKKNKLFKKFLKNSIDPVGTTVINQDGKFAISMNVGMEAKAEDVKVNLSERDMYIEIKMVKWSEDRTSVLSQVFTKKVTLPEEVKVDDITSNLTPEGILKIEAPVSVPEVVIECSDLLGADHVAEN